MFIAGGIYLNRNCYKKNPEARLKARTDYAKHFAGSEFPFHENNTIQTNHAPLSQQFEPLSKGKPYLCPIVSNYVSSRISFRVLNYLLMQKSATRQSVLTPLERFQEKIVMVFCLAICAVFFLKILFF